MYAHAQIQSELRTCSTCMPHPSLQAAVRIKSTCYGHVRAERDSWNWYDQGLYIIFQMDWKRARRRITKYTFPLLQSPLWVKDIASGKKLWRLPWKHQPWSTWQWSVRASTVDHSCNTMCWKPVWGECASWVHSISEKVHYSYIFHVLAILCVQLSQKVKLSRGSTQHE